MLVSIYANTLVKAQKIESTTSFFFSPTLFLFIQRNTMAQPVSPVKNVWFANKPAAVTSSKKTTPTNRAAFQEPIPSSPHSPTVWETLGMTEKQYKDFEERMRLMKEERRREAVTSYLEHEWNSLDFWERRLNILEMLRSRYNKTPGWSAEIIKEVDAIDAQISECLERIDDIWDAAGRNEDMADW